MARLGILGHFPAHPGFKLQVSIGSLHTLQKLHGLNKSLHGNLVFVELSACVKHALRATLLADSTAPNRSAASLEALTEASLEREAATETAEAPVA